MKNWRTTISGVTTLVIGLGLAYVTIAVIPWGDFPPDFDAGLKTGLMSALMLGAIGLITAGIQGITSRDNAESEKAVQRIHAQHEANVTRIAQVASQVEEVKADAVKQASQKAAEVAEKKAEEKAEQVVKERL